MHKKGRAFIQYYPFANDRERYEFAEITRGEVEILLDSMAENDKIIALIDEDNDLVIGRP